RPRAPRHPSPPGPPSRGTPTPVRETALYCFDAAAGDRFFSAPQQRPATGSQWRLLGPYGTLLFTNDFDNTAGGDVDVRTLTQTGRYTLLLEGDVTSTSTGNGSYTFTVRPIPPVVNVPPSLGPVATGGLE